MDDQSGRFVDDNDGIVFVNNIQIHRFRFEREILFARTYRYADGFPAYHFVFELGGLIVYNDRAFFNPRCQDDTEKAVLRCLARHCNFLATFSSSELEAALHARLSDLPPLNSINILSNTPAEWLGTCAPQNLKLQFPTEQPNIRQGYIGSTPTPAHYHSIASQQLQNTHTEALLAIVSPTDSPDEKNLTRTLNKIGRAHV